MQALSAQLGRVDSDFPIHILRVKKDEELMAQWEEVEKDNDGAVKSTDPIMQKIRLFHSGYVVGLDQADQVVLVIHFR